MADAVSVTNMPDSGSKEAVAFRVWQTLRGKHGVPQNMQADINLFIKCVEAAYRNKPDVTDLT